MRSLLTAVSVLCFCAAEAAKGESIPNLTVLLSVEGKASPAAMQEMQAELKSIMKGTGRNLDVRLKEQSAPGETFEDVVLVRLKGNCKIERLVGLMDERGPLAWTHSTEGTVLPFAEVSCDRMAKMVAAALWGGEKKQADTFLGRALGRVLAHEIYHILGKTHEHNSDGSLAKEAITAKQLISDKRITFDARDLQRMLP